jgi:hypothetical protein
MFDLELQFQILLLKSLGGLFRRHGAGQQLTVGIFDGCYRLINNFDDGT